MAVVLGRLLSFFPLKKGACVCVHAHACVLVCVHLCVHVCACVQVCVCARVCVQALNVKQRTYKCKYILY